MINRFNNAYAFLSNFYHCRIEYDGAVFPTVENAFQAAKYVENNKPAVYQEFASITPGEAKRRGRKLPLRRNWDNIRLSIMEELLRNKFADAVLKQRLLATGNHELVEGNHWHDNFWGSCTCDRCRNKGQNQLGKLLMKLRSEYRNENNES